MFSSGMFGICCLTIAAYLSLVTTHMFSTGHIVRNLSTVNCISVFPTPRMSINCLGYSGVEIGQKRLPMPPAMITICVLFFISFYDLVLFGFYSSPVGIRTQDPNFYIFGALKTRGSMMRTLGIFVFIISIKNV